MRELFEGSFRLDLVHPFPQPDPADLERAKPFMERLERFMRERVDSDKIDRDGKIPTEIVKGLGEIGAFGIKIPTEYGGLGLSQYSYTHAVGLVTSQDGNLTALLSAAQSIGVPTPLKLFGTPAQKKKYLPRLAKGAVSAFALTENQVGSDPAALSTTATLSADGKQLHPQRREALVHQRHHRRADGGHGADRAEEDHRLHRGDQLARRRGGAAAPLHGTEGAGERHHPVHQREGAGGERALGRGQGTQARADHPEHRPAHPARLGGGRRQALPGDRRGAGRRSGCSGASRSASTTPSPRRSAGWPRRSSPWRRCPTSPR